VERRLAVFLLVLPTFGCALVRTSDRTFLSNAAADYVWKESEYSRLCVEQKGPPTCAATQSGLKDAKRELVLADRVIHIGAIPSAERSAIRKALKRSKL
jgi:hypothetical protein